MLATRSVALSDSRFVDEMTAPVHPRRDSSNVPLGGIESDVAHDHFEALVGCALQETRDRSSAERCLEGEVRVVLDRSFEPALSQLPCEAIGFGEGQAGPIFQESSGLLVGVEVRTAGLVDRCAEYAAFPGAINTRDDDDSAAVTRHGLGSIPATLGSACRRSPRPLCGGDGGLPHLSRLRAECSIRPRADARTLHARIQGLEA